MDRVVSGIGDNLEQVWITGDLAKGISEILDVILVGAEFYNDYTTVLMGKLEKQLRQKMHYTIVGLINPQQAVQSLLVWEKR